MDNNKPFSFSGSQAVEFLQDTVFRHFSNAGLNPHSTKEWKMGIFQLFGIEVINLPDLDKGNYVLASNHISDFDAIILGLLHPGIRILSKMGWAANKQLMDFLGQHYDVAGIYRDYEISEMSQEKQAEARKHNYQITIDTLKYLKNDDTPRHLLIFPQGTISDINKNSSKRVNPGFAKIALAAKVQVVNIFIEYPEFGGITRVVCGAPYAIANRNLDHSRVWLDDVILLQNQLHNVRKPLLSEKHSLNNNPNEPFF